MNLDKINYLPLAGKVSVKVKNYTQEPATEKADECLKLELEVVEQPGRTHTTRLYPGFVDNAISNMYKQLSKDNGLSSRDILELGKQNAFNIWVVDGYTYFYDREAYLESKKVVAEDFAE